MSPSGGPGHWAPTARRTDERQKEGQGEFQRGGADMPLPGDLAPGLNQVWTLRSSLHPAVYNGKITEFDFAFNFKHSGQYEFNIIIINNNNKGLFVYRYFK